MKKYSKTINLDILFFYPLIAFAFLIIFVGGLIYSATLNAFRTNQNEMALKNATLMSEKLTINQEYANLLISSIDDAMLSVGRLVLENQSEISNEYLETLVKNTDIQYIYWYNPSGTILYDASGIYIGWQVDIDHPIYQFMMGDDDVFVEPIRKSTTEDAYFKFVYLRTPDHFFVQVGVSADYIQAKIESFDYGTILHDIIDDNEDILYGLIIDKTFTAIYDTDSEDIGIVYDDDPIYPRVLQGESINDLWFYPKVGKVIRETSVPIYIDNQIVGILALGYSLDYFNRIQTNLIVIIAGFAIILITGYILMQLKQIVSPIIQLSNTIDRLDVNSLEDHELPKGKGVFIGMYEALQKLAWKISSENRNNLHLNQEISALAYSDFLTKIPNRIAFIETLNQEIEKGNQFAIIYFDLDGFKTINDTKGHSFGDQLLIAFTKRIRDRLTEPAYFARFGGDEFLLIAHFEEELELQKIIASVREDFEMPMIIDNQMHYLDASFGISVFPMDGHNPDELIRKADVAMYVSKKHGKNQVMRFEHSMDQDLIHETEIVEKLKYAIKNDGFTVLYQPQMDINSNQIISLEALLRLKNENLSPAIFIPIAEKVGLIRIIGRIVLKTVITQLSVWQNEQLPIVPIFVNFSSDQIEDETILDYIKDLMSENQVNYSFLGIELTESTLIKNEHRTLATLKAFRELGIQTALDDFGSGQAGLNYMTKYQVSMVKLDKGFSDLYLDEIGLPIFNTIVKLSKLLGFDIIAEGLERQDQIDTLRKTECHKVQGYFYYRPTDAETIKGLLKK
jgi:diguanylate cyclase (GGDEF)-like protein